MYRIEKFEVLKFNFLELESEEYFITKRNEKYGLFPAKCSHRGGPLFFADLTEDGKFLICPWHRNKFKPCVLGKKSPPMVFYRDEAFLVMLKDATTKFYYKSNLNIL
jgi:hypothetical protein